jgi:hypothetical protein
MHEHSFSYVLLADHHTTVPCTCHDPNEAAMVEQIMANDANERLLKTQRQILMRKVDKASAHGQEEMSRCASGS